MTTPNPTPAPSLAEKIMNLPTRGSEFVGSLLKAGVTDSPSPDEKLMLAYRVVHRDARHAAIDLARSHVSEMEERLRLAEIECDLWREVDRHNCRLKTLDDEPNKIKETAIMREMLAAWRKLEAARAARDVGVKG